MGSIKKNIFIFSLALLIASWWILSNSGLVDKLFLPTPYEILNAIKDLFLEKDFFSDISISVVRVMVAFGISLALSIPVALTIINNKLFDDLISPYIDFIRYLPVPTLIPLTILFFGLEETAKIVLLFIGTFFQLVLLIIDDFRAIPQEYYDNAFTLKFSKIEKLKMQFKSASPKIFDNSRITLGWCWTYLVIAELVGAEAGIGHMIKEAQRFSNTADVYVGIFTMGVIGFFSDYIFKFSYPYIFRYK